jgi:alpha-tubulin suppressor-like RCC1 family protein
VQVAGLTGVTAIAASGGHSLAIKNGGTIWAWGDFSGHLGNDAMKQDRPTPVQLNLFQVYAVAAGGSHSLAVVKDTLNNLHGPVWAWGGDVAGQLGDDAQKEEKPTPVRVAGLTGVIAVAGGCQFSLALMGDGTLWAWGNDGNSQYRSKSRYDESWFLIELFPQLFCRSLRWKDNYNWSVLPLGSAEQRPRPMLPVQRRAFESGEVMPTTVGLPALHQKLFT